MIYNLPKAKSVLYDNGLKALLIHNGNSKTVSVKVFIKTGSVDEKPFQAGLSHFIEHLLFKGSANYRGDAFSRNVENMGGYINAGTSKEYTVFYVNIHQDGAQETLKMLADTVSAPVFDSADIDRERKVVIEEIQRHLDNPLSVLYEDFFANLYETSPLKNSIIGYREIIENISRDDIFDYFSSHYVAGNMAAVISGDFNDDDIIKVIDESFGKFAKKEIPFRPSLDEAPHQGKDTVKKLKVETGYLTSGFIGANMDNRAGCAAADLAAQILGGGDSSRLVRVLKEEKKLVYEINCDFYESGGNGLFYIESVFDAKNIVELKKEIYEQIKQITDKGVLEEELNRAKISIKTDWNFDLETPSKIASLIGYWTLMSQPKMPYEHLSEIEKITVKEIRDFFAQYGTQNLISHAALLPKN